MDNDDDDDYPASSTAASTHYCHGCGDHRNFYAADDGYYYCSDCGSQSETLIQTAVPEEAFLGNEGIYNLHYKSQSQNPQNPNSQKSKLQIEQELNKLFHGGGDGAHRKKDGHFVLFNVEEPRDFGWGGVCTDVGKLGDGMRLRYVQGLQVMVQRQCEALVDKCGLSAYVVGVVGSVWLKYVATTRVLGDQWVERVLRESEEAARAQGRPLMVKQEKPTKCKRPRCRYDSEPRNSYGQKAIFIFLRALKRTLPLSSTLAISFLACHIAREPILPTDIYKWASEGKLPYLAAFSDMDRCLGSPSSTCPLNHIAMFRPNQIIGPGKLEAAAASIAQTIGLRLPSVNFYAIAHRYLKELYLPVEKILPHACHIYEWAVPADLWLSSDVDRFPTRACVMSILVVTIRSMYNIQGEGIWEMSQTEVSNPNLQNQGVDVSPNSKNLSSMSENMFQNDDSKEHSDADSSKSAKKLLRIEASDYNCKELLSILGVAYDKINTAHDYTKDLFSYLKRCKDFIFAGTAKSHEERRLIERLWDAYEKRENVGAKDDKQARVDVSINNTPDLNQGMEDNCGSMIQMEEDITVENRLKEEPFSLWNFPASSNVAIGKLKLEMEEDGFEYLPPGSRKKVDGYLQYRRQLIDGKFVYVAPADYYILLRACAKLVQLDAQTLHRSVLSLERRLEWIDKQIDKLF